MPAGSTYTPIATTTLGSAAASYTFSSIPSTYTDLVLVVGISGISATGSALSMQLNSDTGSNYSSTVVYGDGTTAGSTRLSSNTFIQVGAQAIGTGTGVQTLIINLMNYSNSTTYKTVLGRWADASTGTTAGVGLWRSTSAINSIFLQINGVKTFSTGTTFTLYGIASA